MKCKRCGRNAFEKFRGTYYCRECLITKYEGAVESAIRRYRMIRKGERVLTALSGGKDSVAMLSSLRVLSKRIGFDVDAMFIDLGIGRYSRHSLEVSKKVAEMLDVRLHVVRLEDYGFTIDDVRGKVCSVCGNAKRYIMNRFARENGYDAIATGHCAEDILANLFKNMYSGNMEWSEKQRPRMEGFDRIVTRVRPLYEMSERENMVYVLAKGLPFLNEECPNAPSTKWKEIVYEIERKVPGFRVSILRNLARERRDGGDEEFRYCRICGEITTSSVCQFCRNVKKYARKNQ
ncbi:putative ATPase of the PP-loop superfamily implicated in cell cycle control [Geoglobus ahangari]|uniref:Putative ATPase of the PP-loop superfamily implicated in cell cycle control n=1 Tax=Geoglobus ahangari TaxID=113653 RepID=A0A0F7IIA2_9EURY|nr:tRNA 2-thiocytidine biosynthesis TtcA family protein [Geoglobus ahangari]AKG92568.1 putative ATPase of the PP-loop superfamily implicated in cell cycle control [Geoglobus ahangari]